MQVSRLTDLIAGSPLNVTCNIMPVVANIDVPTTINVTWKKNDNTLLDSDRFFTSELLTDGAKMSQSTLVFKSLSRSIDSAYYTCHVQVQSTSSYIYLEDSAIAIDATTLHISGKQFIYIVTLKI